MQKKWLPIVMAGVAAASFVVGPAQGQRSRESTTLFLCQRFAQSQAGRYAFARQQLVGSCLGRVAAEVVLNDQTSIDVSGAVDACISLLSRLGRTDGRSLGDLMEGRVERFCNPAAGRALHSDDDVLGTGSPGVNQPLDAFEIDGYCGGFDSGAGSPGEWVDCLRAVAECTAHQQIAAELPRAIEWLNLLDPEIAASSNPSAAAALAELRAVEQAIDGDSDDDVPDIVCGVSSLTGRLPATGEITSYGPGSDGDIQAGVARSFTDNGDGTITDHATSLMWEKKEDLDSTFVECTDESGSCGNPHDADNQYDWCQGSCDQAGNPMDGTVSTIFLEQLNNRCDDDPSVDCTVGGDADCSGVGGACGFAGYRDWRLPNVNEIFSIYNHGTPLSPATFEAFNVGCSASCDLRSMGTCSCTAGSFHSYWSSTTVKDDTSFAHVIFFEPTSFFLGTDNKPASSSVRAVRQVR